MTTKSPPAPLAVRSLSEPHVIPAEAGIQLGARPVQFRWFLEPIRRFQGT